ncbi:MULTISPECIES: adenylosuccinate synthase [unclassified Enterococcus]|uniref:adenylosuccinate synthase n=1 Tax=unclassified Enterococcus TaxID=2608891 RepID=UPI003D277EEC
MTAIVVIGTQWGDEGKGKITDFLSKDADIIARYQGGDNAGHTIQLGERNFKLRLVPSGIFYPSKLSIIGNGVVVNPKSLIKELEYLKNNGISTDNLRISDRAHVVLPYHIELDRLQEEAKGNKKIGTTINGIGPAYIDKASRIGIRMNELLDKDVFKERLIDNLKEKNQLFTKIYNQPAMDAETLFEEYYAYGQQLKQYVTDTSVLLNQALDSNKKVLFEGAQAVMLDIDHGTYPYVTSSNASAGGVASGSGIGPSRIDKVVGVCKAYTSRVGEGPFPSELTDKIGDHIREVAHEYGTNTGRPRRIGWFDAVAIRHSKRVSEITELSLNSIDVLSGLETVKICTAYELDGKKIEHYPASLKDLSRCTPIYEELPGWSEDITECQTFKELPKNAQHYVERIAQLAGVEIATFSVGPEREKTAFMKPIWE